MVSGFAEVLDMDICSRAEYALEHDEFVVMYQPKFDIKSLRPVGAEALVRWHLPDGQRIPPSRFIPVFERLGYIERLDFLVLEKTCRMLARMTEKGHVPVPVSVNFSRLHIHTPGFAEKVYGVTRLYEIPTRLIEIEFTETAFIHDLQPLDQLIEDLHSFGFTVAMDDFGAGVSALNDLMNLKIDVLKLDRAFLKLTSRNEARAKCIINAIVQMALALGIKVVAEGIEDEYALDMLNQCGCSIGQGYYYSEPVAEGSYTHLLNCVPAFC